MAAMLLERIAGREAPNQVLAPHLVIRDST
jgi:DNA-binding LacI/PurR family transcriptional regulator